MFSFRGCSAVLHQLWVSDAPTDRLVKEALEPWSSDKGLLHPPRAAPGGSAVGKGDGNPADVALPWPGDASAAVSPLCPASS